MQKKIRLSILGVCLIIIAVIAPQLGSLFIVTFLGLGLLAIMLDWMSE
tara:strand:+ start:101 stop:244 length:144 start_codon:yes stop_codon:yes gene_type:complete